MDSRGSVSPDPNRDLRYLIDSDHLSNNIQVLSDVENPSDVLSVALSPNGKAYSVALTNGVVNTYLTRTDRLIYSCNKNPGKERSASATSVRFRPWGKGDANPNKLILATFTNGSVQTFHYPTGECIHHLKENREVITSAYSNIGDTFATSGSDGIINIYDDETRIKLMSYEPPFYENAQFRRVYSIVYNPQSNDEFITGSWDGAVRYYDLRIPRLIKQFEGPFICGEGLAVDPSGREICSASWRRKDSLQLWDYGSGHLIKTISLPFVKSLQESGKGMRRRRSRSRSMSVISLPRMSPSLSSRSSRTPFFVPNVDNVNLSRLPHMLYCCHYLGREYIVFAGSNENSVGVVNKYSDDIVATVGGLRNSVYSIDTFGQKVVISAGNFVGLIKVFLNNSSDI